MPHCSLCSPRQKSPCFFFFFLIKKANSAAPALQPEALPVWACCGCGWEVSGFWAWHHLAHCSAVFQSDLAQPPTAGNIL